MFSGGRKTDHLSVALQIIPSSDHLIKKTPVFSQGWPGKRGNPGRPGDAGPKVSLVCLFVCFLYTEVTYIYSRGHFPDS